jgi:hypothetical protein
MFFGASPRIDSTESILGEAKNTAYKLGGQTNSRASTGSVKA